MAKQTINLGTGELTGDGESIRSAFSKINDNFDELYTKDSNDVVLSAINGHIIPDTDVAYDLGSADKRFRDLYLSGSTIDLGGTTLSIVGGELQLGGVKVPTTADVAATVASAVSAPTGDLTGSVFADDSTLLVDGVNGLVVGEVDTTYVTTENGIGFGQTGYTMAVDEGGVLYLTGTNGDDDIVIRTNSSGGGQYDWTFGKDGTTTFPGGITFNGTLDFANASSIQNFAPGDIYAKNGQFLYVTSIRDSGTTTNVAFTYDTDISNVRQTFYGKTQFGNNGQAPIVDFANTTITNWTDPNVVNTHTEGSVWITVGTSEATIDNLTVRIANDGSNNMEVQFNYDPTATADVSASGDSDNRFSGFTTLAPGNTTWTTLNTITTVGTTRTFTVTDHGFHKVYRGTVVSHAMPDGGSTPGDAYCILERLL